MMHPDDAKFFDDKEHLENLLHEQGLTPEEVKEFSPFLTSLKNWQVPVPAPAETQHLLMQLLPSLSALSPVQEAIQRRLATPVRWFLDIVIAQLRMLHASFWVVNSALVLLGTLLMLIPLSFSKVFVLEIIVTLSTYFGIARAYRAQRCGVMEFELTCPYTLQQLTLVRLLLVCGGSILPGLFLSWLLWQQTGGSFISVSLYWFMPLFLISGITFFLALHFSISRSAIIACGIWSVLMLLNISWAKVNLLPVMLVTGSIGVLLLVIALYLEPYNVQRFFPTRA